MNQLKSNLQAIIATLHTYDYILFGAAATLFILLLLLAVLLRSKIVISLLLFITSLIVIVTGPIVGYTYIHANLYKTEIS